MASGIGSLYGMSQDFHNQLLVGWCLVLIHSDAATIRQDAAAEAAMAYKNGDSWSEREMQPGYS